MFPRRSTPMAMFAVILAATGLAASDGIDAEKLIEEVETQYRGESSHAVAEMRIRTRDWTRTLKMEMWARGRDEFQVEILEPAKERGVKTLKIGDEIWNYLPKIDRLMKIPSGMMGEGWMGSHLTNDDLVKGDKVEQLYSLEVAHRGPATAVVVATPEPDAAVVWGRIVYEVDLERRVPTMVRYFDEDGELVRTMTFSDVERVEGRWVPMTMTVSPVDEPDESTRIHYERLDLGAEIDGDRFSLRSLRRGR